METPTRTLGESFTDWMFRWLAVSLLLVGCAFAEPATVVSVTPQATQWNDYGRHAAMVTVDIRGIRYTALFTGKFLDTLPEGPCDARVEKKTLRIAEHKGRILRAVAVTK